jgi:hypothetical protein
MEWPQFLAWERASRDTLDFKRAYVDVAGDLLAGLLLSQIVYWYLPGRNGQRKLQVQREGHFWLAKRREDWWAECRLHPQQVDRALQILASPTPTRPPLLETRLFQFAGRPTLHLRLLPEAFLGALGRVIQDGEEAPTPPEGPSVTPSITVTAETVTETVTPENGPESPINTPFSPNGKMDFPESGKWYTKNTTKTTESLSPGLDSPGGVAASHVADRTSRERENSASCPRKRPLVPALTEPPASPEPPDGGTTSQKRAPSPAPTEPSPASAAALLSEPERRAVETALTQEGCTLRQTAALLTQYTPDQVRALLAQATERRRAGERNGGMWRSAARGEWVPDMQAGTPPPDPAGARAARQAAAYREEFEAWQQAAEATQEENRQALERAKSCLPWQRAGSTA